MAVLIKDVNDLAEVLTAMPFGKLMEVASQLVAMNEDDEFDRDVKTPLGMAQTLYDWAESQDDDQ